MSSQPLKVLVLLATGKQGSAAVHKLSSTTSSDGQAAFNVLALTRNVKSDAAKQLGALPNVQLVEGSVSSTESLNKLLSETGQIDGLVMIQLDAETHPGGPQGEIDEAKRIIDAAKAHKVKHIVYHGMELAGVTHSDLAYVRPKVEVLQYVKDASEEGKAYKWTVLQPCNFFENFAAPGQTAFMITWLTKVEHKPIQMVSVNDIAFFGAHALLNPGDYNGKAISLGGDLVTRDKLESEWKQVGLPEHFLTDVPEEVVKEAFAGSALETLTEFVNAKCHGELANVKELRKVHPGLLDLAGFLKANHDAIEAQG